MYESDCVYSELFIVVLTKEIVDTQLFSAIPYACATVTLLVITYWSDRLSKKGTFLLGTLITAFIGYVILIAVESAKVRIFGTCLIVSGIYTSIVLLVTWMAINIAGYTKRATIWAGCEIVSQSLSIAGTHIYDDPPRYIRGHAVMLGFLGLSILLAVVLMVIFSKANAKKERTEQMHLERGDLSLHPHMSQTLEDVQDDHLFFRYIL